ncbi:MAG: hypothetical protein CVU89_00865 [Firmicutes bacterium HGW-Firmicutes-14]|nr:MAG: hypothetical protein CVU89_00865 [Firmicutes bacterium HGW-Firmicutes-14]
MNRCPGEYTVFATDFGWMALFSTPKGIYASVLPQDTAEEAEYKLLSRIPFVPRLNRSAFKELEKNLQLFFRGLCRDIICDIDWSWSAGFQKRVLKVVREIPAGSYLSYSEVARLTGSPHSARAVGRALASNPIPIIIPCHRVVGKNGNLGGFTGAPLEMKARLLSVEGANIITEKKTRD